MTRTVLLLATLSALVAGCNTVHGIGQDIAKGGEVIQKAAK
jgi:entericidin B